MVVCKAFCGTVGFRANLRRVTHNPVLPPPHTPASMARIVRAYRKYWPTEAVLKGKVVLEDLMLCSFSTKELVESWDVATDQRWGGK